MNDNIPSEVIAWFRESAPYIEQHRDKTLVICISGELVSNGFDTLAKDIGTLHHLGIRIVLIHGARPQIETALAQHNIHTDFINSTRLTSKEAMTVAKQVLGGVQADILAQLSAQPQSFSPHIDATTSKKPLTLCSGNFITAQPIGVVDGVDYLFTGKVRKVNHLAIEEQLTLGNIALISSMGFSPSGESFNLTVEETAVAVAQALNADKLVFFAHTESLTETDSNTPIDVLSPNAARALAPNVPKNVAHILNHAAQACEKGVQRAHILDQSLDGALFSELYTRDGVGTMITNDDYQYIRQAQLDDVSGLIALLTPFEEQGVVVYRSREQIELDINHFTVMVRDGKVIGCVAVYDYPSEGMAEVACMITSPEYSDSGRGSLLLNTALEQARAMNLSSVFVLTTQAEDWFKERGFKEHSPDDLPMDKKLLYNWQRQSKVLFKPL